MSKPRQPIVRFDKLKVRALLLAKIEKKKEQVATALYEEATAMSVWRIKVLSFALDLVTTKDRKKGLLYDNDRFRKAVLNKRGNDPCLQNLSPPEFEFDSHERSRLERELAGYKLKLRALDAMPDGKAFRMSEEAFNHWLGDGGDE